MGQDGPAGFAPATAGSSAVRRLEFHIERFERAVWAPNETPAVTAVVYRQTAGQDGRDGQSAGRGDPPHRQFTGGSMRSSTSGSHARRSGASTSEQSSQPRDTLGVTALPLRVRRAIAPVASPAHDRNGRVPRARWRAIGARAAPASMERQQRRADCSYPCDSVAEFPTPAISTLIEREHLFPLNRVEVARGGALGSAIDGTTGPRGARAVASQRDCLAPR
jgi:hypothetical protein